MVECISLMAISPTRTQAFCTTANATGREGQ